MARKNDHTFPALNPAEAKQIVRELGRALDSDREWAAKFQAMLVCRIKPKAADLKAGSHKKTVFGRWYAGQVNDKLSNHPGFAAVGKNSERMHDRARDLACMVRDGADIKPANYQAYVKSVDHFRSSLRKMLSEAWDVLRYTDPLTGVMTRTAMQIRIEEEQERVRRSGQPCSIGMMDLDHFKSVNDTHGHQAGDKVLETVANYVKGNLRRYDQVFRYGGEEFVILLPNTTTANAKKILDRLRRSIKRRAVKIGKNKTLHVSASFGVAELLPDNPIKEFLELADQALYTAKKAGRNRVRVWQNAKAPKA